MQISINKAKLTSITVIILLITSFLVILNYSVQAQDEYENIQEGGSVPLPAGVTPDLTLQSSAYLSFRPNPVGVGQTILVNMWVNPPLHASRYFKDFKVTITKPDGTPSVVTIDSYRADTTAWFEWIIDQAGTWKLKFEFPGGYYPAGNYTAYRGDYVLGEYRAGVVYEFTESCYYTPASTPELELMAQDEPVLSWPPADLPTDYWTRPAQFQNREWWTILGDFPWSGPGGGPMWDQLYPNTNIFNNADYDFLPWVQAPNTAHVVWKRQGAISGIVGGDLGSYGLEIIAGNPQIIYAGRAYQNVLKPFNGVTQRVWQCYDIRTGEIYWEQTGVTHPPTVIEYDQGYAEVPGAEPAGFIAQVYLLYIGNGRLIKYDPWSGAMLGNYSIAPLTSGTYYMNKYALSVQNLGSGNYRLINWTTQTLTNRGRPLTIEERVMSNITWPISNFGSSYDLESGIAVNTATITPPASGAWYGTRIQAFSMITGAELWDKEIEETMYSSSCTVADHGKVALLTMNGYFLGYDLSTGNLVWQSDIMDYPHDETGFGSYAIASAYGLFYRQAYSGVYAFNWDNGKLAWKYEAPTPYEYETPYTNTEGKGVYSWDPFSTNGIIADGKFYVQNCEHTPTEPITRGWGLHCIDATTGEEIWNITGLWADYLTRDRTVSDLMSILPGPISDGYLFASSSDGYMYVIGKGKSVTTVTAPKVAVPKGSTITIEGTVLDLSPAQTGTPCVSRESMAIQMEYLHTQFPINGLKGDAILTGVPVTLTAISSDGSECVDIGTTTTSGYYGTFGFAWTPTAEGTYEIVASFPGDDSYGSSGASTFVTVGPAASPEGTIEPEPTPLISTELAIAIAVIAIAVIGAVGYLVLLKRK